MKYPRRGYEAYGHRRGPEYVGCYDYHVFISYTRVDESVAAEVAETLARSGLTIFFAPESFQPLKSMSLNEDANFWSRSLRYALLSSCHYVGILSKDYLRRPWAGGLELNGFLNISRVNARRSMTLINLNISQSDFPAHLANTVLDGSIQQIVGWAIDAVEKSDLSLGTKYDPTRCFSDLPLTEIPRGGPWFPWGDGSRYDPDPSYETYEDCVRELMVLLACGADPRGFPARFRGMSPWQAQHIEDATNDALYLVDHGVSPF